MTTTLAAAGTIVYRPDCRLMKHPKDYRGGQVAEVTGFGNRNAKDQIAHAQLFALAPALLAALRDLAHIACCDPDGDASDRAAFETIHARALAVIAAAEDRL